MVLGPDPPGDRMQCQSPLCPSVGSRLHRSCFRGDSHGIRLGPTARGPGAVRGPCLANSPFTGVSEPGYSPAPGTGNKYSVLVMPTDATIAIRSQKPGVRSLVSTG